MREHRTKTAGKNLTAGRLFAPFGAFALLYIIGMSVPLEATPHYYNLISRIWNWTEILILLTAVFYIIKTRTFRWRQAAMALLLGAVCMVSMFRDPRTADIIVTGLCAAAAFYAGCRLYELAEVENVSVQGSFTDSVRYFFLGAAVSVPLALLNVLYFSLNRRIYVRNVLYSAVFALKPAIAEEVVFRFFLLAYAYYLMHGKPNKCFQNICIYALLVVPHELLHYPDMILESPALGIGMSILGSAVFGLPMALLMKRKNLQMAAGLHWFIDFVRFAAGF